MASSGHGQDIGAGWVTREGLTPGHQFVQADTALQGALADWLFGPAGSSVPATATVTGQTLTLALGAADASGWAVAAVAPQSLALAEGAAAARGGAVAAVSGLTATITLGVVTAGAEAPPAPAPSPSTGLLLGGLPRHRRPPLTREDLARLFPEEPSVAAVAVVAPLALTLGMAPGRAQGDAAVPVSGVPLALTLGGARARGVHNPSDEEMLAWLAAA